VRVHLCGVRGSTPAPGADFIRYGGHTSCVAVAHDDAVAPQLILDAGTGVREVTKLLGDQPFDGTILLTHLHWDHFQGLPFFAAGDRDDARVTLLLPEQGNGVDAASVLAGAMSPPYFPVKPSQLRGSWSFALIAPGEHRLQGFSVLAREIPHKGGRTFGYRVSDGKSTITYMPDHGPTVLGDGPAGFGEYHPAAMELASTADALVHDAQLLTREELVVEGRFGHAVVDYGVELSRRAGAHLIVPFHHRADRTDAALDELRRRFDSSPEIQLAVQGAVLQL
jgi:ribonuclease BN (tRNA processing enzyme)